MHLLGQTEDLPPAVVTLLMAFPKKAEKIVILKPYFCNNTDKKSSL